MIIISLSKITSSAAVILVTNMQAIIKLCWPQIVTPVKHGESASLTTQAQKRPADLVSYLTP